MTTYVVVENATGIIVNRIELDDPAQWEVPAGHSIVVQGATPMDIGGTYIDGVYTPPPQPSPPVLPPSVDQAARANQRIDAGVAAAVTALPPTKLVPPHGPWPACSIYQNATQAVTRNVATKIKFDTREYDVTSAFDIPNSRFKPVVAGYYQISCGCGSATGVDLYASIYKNGTEYRRGTISSLGNSRLSTLVYLNGTTDYAEGYVLSTSSNFSTATGVVVTSFSAVLVQPELLPYETQERANEVAAAVKAMLGAHSELKIVF